MRKLFEGDVANTSRNIINKLNEGIGMPEEDFKGLHTSFEEFVIEDLEKDMAEVTEDDIDSYLTYMHYEITDNSETGDFEGDRNKVLGMKKKLKEKYLKGSIKESAKPLEEGVDLDDIVTVESVMGDMEYELRQFIEDSRDNMDEDMGVEFSEDLNLPATIRNKCMQDLILNKDELTPEEVQANNLVLDELEEYLSTFSTSSFGEEDKEEMFYYFISDVMADTGAFEVEGTFDEFLNKSYTLNTLGDSLDLLPKNYKSIYKDLTGNEVPAMGTGESTDYSGAGVNVNSLAYVYEETIYGLEGVINKCIPEMESTKSLSKMTIRQAPWFKEMFTTMQKALLGEAKTDNMGQLIFSESLTEEELTNNLNVFERWDKHIQQLQDGGVYSFLRSHTKNSEHNKKYFLAKAIDKSDLREGFTDSITFEEFMARVSNYDGVDLSEFLPTSYKEVISTVLSKKLSNFDNSWIPSDN